jgi:hypothetical protein
MLKNAIVAFIVVAALPAAAAEQVRVAGDEPFRSASGVRCSTAPYLLADCQAIRRPTDH